MRDQWEKSLQSLMARVWSLETAGRKETTDSHKLPSEIQHIVWYVCASLTKITKWFEKD